MPATHSFSLTPKASKLLRGYKYPRKLGGASKSVSDAIEFFWTENVVQWVRNSTMALREILSRWHASIADLSTTRERFAYSVICTP